MCASYHYITEYIFYFPPSTSSVRYTNNKVKSSSCTFIMDCLMESISIFIYIFSAGHN